MPVRVLASVALGAGPVLATIELRVLLFQAGEHPARAALYSGPIFLWVMPPLTLCALVGAQLSSTLKFFTDFFK